MLSSTRRYFYPRPPRGGRPTDSVNLLSAVIFLSTPSARRATASARPPGRSRPISIHALREEGDVELSMSTMHTQLFLSTPSARRATNALDMRHVAVLISIHALREEGDLIRIIGDTPTTLFLSTPSARRATLYRPVELRSQWISIHALREEGDPEVTTVLVPLLDFYPRPPRGGRQQKQRQNLYFQTNYTTFCTNLEEP